jgi:CMP-N,N'-diacetyllegionaminic acid synthase|tara:strand:- start:7389 stop:8087 length:699 start_codon:yes stop_codon:yes gene_type:complete
LKTICFIGARGGSKGVPQKNIRLINGKPLIAHTIISALDSGLYDHVVVSTEDKKIAQIAKKYGAEIPFLRPKNLSTDTTAFADVMMHGINELKTLDYDFNILVNRDCTVPFIRIKDMKNSIKLLKNKDCDAVFGVYRQHLNPYFNIVEKNYNGFLQLSKKLKNRPKSRQESPKVYQLNGLFVYNVDKFLKYKVPLLPKSLPYEIPVECGFMIDTELEFKIAEFMMKNKSLFF